MKNHLPKFFFILFSVIVFSAFESFGQANISAGGSITENFNTIGNSTTVTLPAGWRVDAQSTARTLGTYAVAGNVTTRSGGAGISSSAASGIYNYGAGIDNDGTDRAIGGLSAGTSNRTVNIYLDLLNNGSGQISDLSISYNIEKYRTGSNAAGFTMQMYYSTDGATWVSAGSDFITSFAADANTDGVSPAPSATVSVSSKTLAQTISTNSHLYLLWSYSVSSGASGANAQGLGIDDITIQANSAGPLLITDKSSIAFNPIQVNTSATQSFTVEGVNLTNDLVITPPSANFRIKTGANPFSHNAITITPSSGTVASTTIDVEFTPTAAQSYSGSVSLASTGAITQTVSLTGTGTTFSGMETFDNSAATGSYADGSFTGQNGIVWNYTHSRDDGGYQINGKGIMLRNSDGGSKVTSGTISGGIGDFSVNLRKAFTGTGDRQVEVFINGISRGTSILFGGASGADATIHTFTIPNINIAGNFIIEIRNISGGQVTVDDISWTAVPTNPYLTVTPTSLDFNSIPVNSSATQSFTVEGINLTNNVTITPSNAAYRVRTSGNAFSNSVTLPASGTLASTTIDVEFAPTVAQAYPATIEIASQGATTRTITLSGEGTPVSVPSLTTTAISNLTLISATSGGDVTSDGGAAVTARGIVWSTTQNPDVNLATKTTESGTTGTFTSNITGLTSNTTYYVRAYATNSQGTSYGNEISFTTLKEAPAIQASDIVFSGVKARTLTVNWTNGDGERRVVLMNTTNSFTSPVNGTSPAASTTYSGGEQVVYNGFGSSVKVNGLSENTTYWLRVYEYNNQGTTFTTYNTATASNNPASQITTALQTPPQVIISQVYEGTSNNKWIEITNIGTTPVDLAASDLILGQYNIGGSDGNGVISGSPSTTFELTGTLDPDSSLLIRHSSAVLPAYAMGKLSNLVNGGVNAFNGNDALALLINSTDIVDAFGHGINNMDKSYHRVHTVSGPNPNFNINEWILAELPEVESATLFMSVRLGVHSSPNNPLPVSLISFEAKPTGNQVSLTWATASEKDNDRFEVQRSSNGESFTTFATVAGKGTTNQVTNYAATDENPLKGIAYYRLKQVDFDGTTSYSKIVAVNIRGEKAVLAVYPNPAGNNITISLAGNAKAESVSVVNMLGQVVMQKQTDKTLNAVELNIAALPAGAYQVIVTTETGRNVQKFVKIAQ